MKANVYEVGPMRGRPEFGFPEFMGVERHLRTLDWVGDIFNPAQRDLDTGFDPTGMTGFENLNDGTHRFSLRDAFGADLGWIAERADVICLLPGWEKSSGALAEMALAAALGLKAGALWEIALVDGPVNLRDAKDILDEMLDARTAVVTAAPPVIVETIWAALGGTAGDWPMAERITAALSADRVKARQGMVEAPALTALARAVGHTGKVFVPAHPDGPPVPYHPDDWEAMAVAQHVHSDDGRCIKVRSGQFCPPAGDVPASSVIPDGEVRVTSPTGGQKGQKLARFELFPTRPLWAVAELYGYGAGKYQEARNWEKGHEWSLSYAAMQRHANLFWSCEDDDPETGLPHLAAVVFHALSLMEYRTTHPEFDDRPGRLQLAQPEVA